MSKSISFPILEIVTLLVVLFACVLVIIPGFDDFATSMLFDMGKQRSVSDVNVAAKTDADLEEVASAVPSKNLAADQTSINRVVESDFPELKIQRANEFDQETSSEDDQFLESEYPLEKPETLETPPVDHLVTDSKIKPQQEQQPITFDFRTFDATDHLSSAGDSQSAKGFPLNGYVQTKESPEQLTSSELPKIIHQVGNSLQQQPSPTFIRMSQFFKTDTRVVVNSTYSNQDPDLSPISAVETQHSKISPNDQPYQIRTTSRPNSSSPSNVNDFVPKR